MEQKLKALFDYQRFEKNERLEKIIAETESRYAQELSDDDLSLVNAAGEPEIGAYNRPIILSGIYYSDSYGNVMQKTAIGRPCLTLGMVYTDGRAAPCEIRCNGTTIGWAPWDSITLSE